jgi:hypothetical protein
MGNREVGRFSLEAEHALKVMSNGLDASCNRGETMEAYQIHGQRA